MTDHVVVRIHVNGLQVAHVQVYGSEAGLASAWTVGLPAVVAGYGSVEVCLQHQVPDGHCAAIVVDGAYADAFHIGK